MPCATSTAATEIGAQKIDGRKHQTKPAARASGSTASRLTTLSVPPPLLLSRSLEVEVEVSLSLELTAAAAAAAAAAASAALTLQARFRPLELGTSAKAALVRRSRRRRTLDGLLFDRRLPLSLARLRHGSRGVVLR